MIHTVKGFGIVSKAEIDVFLELSCFFDVPADVGNLTSGSSAFSKTGLNIWKFTAHVLLKPGVENLLHCYSIQVSKPEDIGNDTADQVTWSTFGGLLVLSLLALGKADLLLGNRVRGANFRIVSSEGPSQGCLQPVEKLCDYYTLKGMRLS